MPQGTGRTFSPQIVIQNGDISDEAIKILSLKNTIMSAKAKS